jgi:hypothetical protein
MKRAIYIGKCNYLTLNQFGWGMTGEYDETHKIFYPDDKQVEAIVYELNIKDLYFPHDTNPNYAKNGECNKPY